MITLKNIKVLEDASDETYCYTADLWFGGKKIGHVSNHGTGGPDLFHGDQAAYNEANAWCKANLPTWDCNGTQEPTDIEIHCGELLNAYMADKAVKQDLARIARLMKTKIVVLEGPTLRTFTPSNKAVLTAAHVAYFQAKHPDKTVLNVLPKEHIAELLRAAA